MLWLVISVCVVVALVWAATLILKWSLWIAIAVTVLAVLLVIGAIVFRRLRAKARAAALERELLKQAGQQAERMRPDRRAAILELQEQMRSSIAALKRTKLGAGGQALYALPWYVIVGPPAAGKTTALERSGLAFTTPPGSGGPKVRGTAGTKNCDWWFSRDAILLDTAGRFTTAEEDQDEWFEFLDLVRRFRPERPLDGMIVAVNVDQLLGATEQQIEELASKLRARIDEVTSRLEFVLPVYVMFTKADLIAGFVEFWSTLNKNERAQAWGASFKLDDPKLSDPAQAFENEFDVLTRVLHARMLDRLNREQLPEVRAKVIEYPVQFDALRAPLARFVGELFRTNPYSEAPVFRGFYFSSGTQTGRPIERVLNNMIRGFDLRLSPNASAAQPEPQSYFVTDLFDKVIFPDRNVAASSSKRLNRQNRKQVILSAVAVGLTLFALVPALLSYARNRDLIAETSQDTLHASRVGVSDTEAAEVLLRRIRQLEQAEGEFDVAGWWGPYTAPELHTHAKAMYLGRLRKIMEGSVREQLTSEVRAIGTMPRNDASSFLPAYDKLKLYLMLTRHDRLQPAWANEHLQAVWKRTMEREGTAIPPGLADHTGYYLQALAADKTWAWPEDTGIVREAQGRLSDLSLEDLRYSWLLEHAKGIPPIKPEQLFVGPAALYVSGTVEIPGAYRALGWAKIREALESKAADFELESWVLGQEVTSVAPTPERLRERYFEYYARAWWNFLAAVDVKIPGTIDETISELRALTELKGPYERLYAAVNENLVLDFGPKTLLGKLADKAEQKAEAALARVTGQDAGAPQRTPTPLEEEFRALLTFSGGDPSAVAGAVADSGIKQYLRHLSELQAHLSQAQASQMPATAEINNKLDFTATAVEGLLGRLDSKTSSTIRRMLMNPIFGSKRTVDTAASDQLSDRWKAEVYEPWTATLATRYPFADSRADATVAEFAEFFRPGTGKLWAFYEQNLADKIERSGDRFVPRITGGASAYRSDFLTCLSHAQQITDAVFGTNPQPLVPFTVLIHPPGNNIVEVALLVDSQPTVQKTKDAERWQNAQWPGKGPQKGGVVVAKGPGFADEMRYDGEFGFFRLLASGDLKPGPSSTPSAPVLVGTWSLAQAGPVTIDVRPSKSMHPFTPRFFRRFRCPADIVMATSGSR